MTSFFITRKDGSRHEVLVDDQDYEAVMAQGTWAIKSPSKYSRTSYAQKNMPRSMGHRVIRLHRFIMEPGPGVQVDHINGNGLDNRRSNLRLCCGTENKANTSQRADNTSGFKGVSYSKEKRAFRAYIGWHGKTLHLGYFKTPEAAHEAYKLAAVEYFGEFAKFE